MDLEEVIGLDGIDILPDSSGFRVPSHDLRGQLPEKVVKESGYIVLDETGLGNEACRLAAIVRLRDQMVRWLAGGAFLPPTGVGNQATVGFRVGTRTRLAEVQDFLAAHHKLHEEVGRTAGEVQCRERLGGILRHYHRKAA